MENTIPELGGGNRQTFLQTEPEDTVDQEEDAKIQFFNTPYVTWTYTDHKKKCNFVNVAVPLISGTTDVNFTISDDGLTVFLNYTWPVSIYKPLDLYHDEINSENPEIKISADHPKIHSLVSHLLNEEITENSFPRGRISIKLPVAVVREVDGWVKKPIKKKDGSKIVLLELKAYQDKSIIKDSDTSIIFD